MRFIKNRKAGKFFVDSADHPATYGHMQLPLPLFFQYTMKHGFKLKELFKIQFLYIQIGMFEGDVNNC